MSFCLRLILLVIISVPYISLAQQHFSPKEISLKLFNKYKPVIERKNEAIVDTPDAITGDINGDGREDCIVSFVMTSKNGGNALIGHGSAIYLNTGASMKIVGAFPEFKFCYYLDHIQDQVIFGKEYDCAPPYNNIIRERKFAFVDGKIKEVF
jgi:hypothetical protein